MIAGIIFFTCTSSYVYAAERISLGYIYSTSKSHTEIVEETNGGVNVVSPTCFDLTLKGHLDIKPIMDENFVENMHAQGVKVTPFLSNHWGQKRAQAALKNADVLISEIIEAVEKYNFDGVNVDLENLSSKDRDSLTEFMRLLREAMPEEKTVSIAVAPNPGKLTTTWLAAYDYENLAKYADYLVLMAYDEHCYGGAEGPVASIEFVEKSITSVLEVAPRDKIVLGIPMYGRFWEVGAPTGGEAIINAQVPRIIKKFNVVPNYIEAEGTPMLEVTVNEGETGPYVNGRFLDAGTYRIWYENERSIKEKLALVNKYELLGAGVWALDNEEASMWDYYKEALNEVPFETVDEVRIRQKLEYAMKNVVAEPVDVQILNPDVKYRAAYEMRCAFEKFEADCEMEFEFDEHVEHAIIPNSTEKMLVKLQRKVLEKKYDSEVLESMIMLKDLLVRNA